MSLQQPHKVCIIGCGVSGSLLLLKLLETFNTNSNHSNHDICVIDPAFDGGDLGRRWPEVLSNSTWGNFLEFGGKLSLLKPYLDTKRDKYAPEAVTPVWELSNTIRQALAPHLQSIDANTCYVQSVDYSTQDQLWTIHMKNQDCQIVRQAKTIIYAPGGNPKQMNLFAKPQIPLEAALNPKRLASYVDPSQHILLFGLSHSGTLILKNLVAAGVRVSAVHRSEMPFQFQRDGVFNGIKQTAAAFADELLANPNPLVHFINVVNDTEGLLRAYTNCDDIICATGFDKNTSSMEASVDGVPVDLAKYDSATGALAAAPNAFGLGMAYPSLATFEGKLYEEAGIESFVNHLDSIIPAILSSL